MKFEPNDWLARNLIQNDLLVRIGCWIAVIGMVAAVIWISSLIPDTSGDDAPPLSDSLWMIAYWFAYFGVVLALGLRQQRRERTKAAAQLAFYEQLRIADEAAATALAKR